MDFKLFSKNSISFSQERKHQLLIVALTVAALAVLFVLYFGFLRPSHPGTIGGMGGSSVGGEVFLEDITKKINFDIDFLKGPYFQALELYGEWPMQIEEKSRPNPFLPY